MAQRALPAGTMVNAAWRIERVLGEGGFGVTYEAVDAGDSAHAALKEYFPAGYGARDAGTTEIRPVQGSGGDVFRWGVSRFLLEANTLARLEHPSIVRVASVFEANGTAYMALAYETGGTLGQWLKTIRRTPTQRELDKLVWCLTDALAQVHSLFLLHRDVKPDNIMMRPDGTPVLIDFGAAKVTLAQHTRTIGGASSQSLIVVSDGYSPPEQYAPGGNLQGPFTDVYALAATLYYAINGKPPSAGATRMLRDDYVPLSGRELPGTWRPGFLAGIDAALATDRDARPQSMLEFRRALGLTEAIAREAGALIVTAPPAEPKKGSGGWTSILDARQTTPKREAGATPLQRAYERIKSRGGLPVAAALALVLIGGSMALPYFKRSGTGGGTFEKDGEATSGGKGGGTSKGTTSGGDGQTKGAGANDKSGGKGSDSVGAGSKKGSSESTAGASEASNAGTGPDSTSTKTTKKSADAADTAGTSGKTESKSSPSSGPILRSPPDDKNALPDVKIAQDLIKGFSDKGNRTDGDGGKTTPSGGETKAGDGGQSGKASLAGDQQTDHAERLWKEALAGFGVKGGGQGSKSVSTDGVRFSDALKGGGTNSWTLEGVGQKSNLVSPRNIALSPDGRFIAIADPDNQRIRLWQTGTGKLLQTFNGHKETIDSIAISADGQTMMSIEGLHTAFLWDVATGKLIRKIETGGNGFQDVRPIAAQPGLDAAFVGAGDDGVYIWNARGEQLRKLPWSSSINIVEPSVDGRVIATSSGQSLVVWEVVGDRRSSRNVKASEFAITRLAISPDGRYALTQSSFEEKGGATKLWDLATLKVLRTLPGNDAAFTWLDSVTFVLGGSIYGAQTGLSSQQLAKDGFTNVQAVLAAGPKDAGRKIYVLTNDDNADRTSRVRELTVRR